MDHLRYPIGRYVPPTAFDAAQVAHWVDDIAALPADFRAVAEQLDDTQLEQPYRPEGWTARQVIHHVPDSHMHALLRCKHTLTEDHPTVKPYHEADWAKLPDVDATPIGVSLDLLEALHGRWTPLLNALTPAQWQRTYLHPGYGRTYTLYQVAGLYAWHGRHHLAHLQLVLAG